MQRKKYIGLVPLQTVLVMLSVFYGVAALAVTIIDTDGQQVEFQEPFSRIISLYGAHTENLYALGLDREIIGVSTSDDFPEQVLVKKKFSYREDAEKFIGAKPDLVLTRPMISRGYAGLVDKLRRAGITVVSLQPNSIDEMYAYWQILGKLTGREAAALNMQRSFKRQVAEIDRQVAKVPLADRKKVYFESIHRKMKTFTPTSMAMFVLTTAGGINIAATDSIQVRNTNIAEYGKERILSHANDIDVFLAQVGKMNRVFREDIENEPGFAAIRAVQEGEIYLINEKLVSRPTLRMLEGIQLIQTILYPDIFADARTGR